MPNKNPVTEQIGGSGNVVRLKLFPLYSVLFKISTGSESCILQHVYLIIATKNCSSSAQKLTKKRSPIFFLEVKKELNFDARGSEVIEQID